MTDGRLWPRDHLSSRLEAFADRIEGEFPECCRVERTTVSQGLLRLVHVSPTRGGASPTGWMDMVDELQVFAGEGDCRWELARTEADVQFIENVVESVLAGRVTEAFGPSRSKVAVTLADGTVAEQTVTTGLRGLIPSPGWRPRGRHVRYGAYRA